MKRLVHPLLAAIALLITIATTQCKVDDEVKPVAIEEDTTALVRVSQITPYSAHIEGIFCSAEDTSTKAGIRYSLQNTRFLTTTGDVAEARLKSRGVYELDLENLYADTTYYFSTYVEYDGKRTYSDTYLFRTHRLTAFTSEVGDIYAYGAQLGLTLSEEIDPAKFRGSYGIYYSNKPRVIREQSALAKEPYLVGDLMPNHDYYCAAFVCQKTAYLTDVYIWGETIKFTTPDLGVETYEPEDVTTYSADLSGYVNVRFDETTDFGFLIFEKNREVTLDSVDAKSDQQIIKVKADETSDLGFGRFATTYTNLSINKKYYVRAYANIYAKVGNQTILKTYYGEIYQFHTRNITMAEGDAADLGLSVEWATANYEAKSAERIGTMGTPADFLTQSFADGWRLPTHAEAQELVEKCHWAWKKYNGQNGTVVTDRTGLSIFIPANMKIGSTYTYGVYMVADTIDAKGHIASYRFVQDAADDAECGKTYENEIDSDAEVGIRLVRER